MARVRLPESQIAARRRRRRTLFAWIIWGILVLLCGFLLWLARAPFLQIEKIEVAGTETVAGEALEALAKEVMSGRYANLLPKTNIFLYPKRELMAALLARYPTLSAVSIGARDFSTISIEAHDREPRALWCGEAPERPQACLLLDEEGVAYAAAPEFSENPYAHYFGALLGESNPRHYLSPAEFRSLAALVDALVQQRAGVYLEGVFVDGELDARVRFSDGFVLVFALRDDGGDVFERFTLALAAEPFKNHSLGEFQYLDLRFGDRLYYKLKSQ